MTTGGTVILSTMNHRPISSYLTSQPRTATLTTSATSIQDSSTLVTDLITRLDKGVWGGGLRRGKTLTVDLTKSSGVEFSIQPCSFMR